MKKVLIVASDMEIGGAERALLGLLNSFDTEQYKVDLFLLRHQGPFLKDIPAKVNLLPENSFYSDLGIPIQRVIRKGHLSMLLARTYGKYKAQRYIKKHQIIGMNSVEIHYSFLYTKRLLPMISKEKYDLAIGFTIPYYLVNEKVNATKKIVWLHTDYSCIAGDTEEEYKVWSAYHNIVSISDDVTRAFLKKFPTLKEKIIRIDNIISTKMIEQQATRINVEKEMPDMDGEIKFLSIGRFCEAKNFDNIPDICARILEKGNRIKWYIIGFGSDEELIKSRILEEHMEKHVILLGKKENPYPYIKRCDFYIQPSRFEGKSVTVSEAQILHKPVIITNYPTAASQIKDGVDGFIVPLDNKECADAICRILCDEMTIDNIINNMKAKNYSNEREVHKVYQLIE